MQRAIWGNIKMATKDWKKVKKDKYYNSCYSDEWHKKDWEKNPGSVSIMKENNGWRVTSSHPLRRNRFRTKTQAIAHAKAYMRKH